MASNTHIYIIVSCSRFCTFVSHCQPTFTPISNFNVAYFAGTDGTTTNSLNVCGFSVGWWTDTSNTFKYVCFGAFGHVIGINWPFAMNIFTRSLWIFSPVNREYRRPFGMNIFSRMSWILPPVCHEHFRLFVTNAFARHYPRCIAICIPKQTPLTTNISLRNKHSTETVNCLMGPGVRRTIRLIHPRADVHKQDIWLIYWHAFVIANEPNDLFAVTGEHINKHTDN